ncbi:hypothetical protein MHYP_G00330450 [Metynnis hypsauchen]
MQPVGTQSNIRRKCYGPNRSGYETFTLCVRATEKFGSYPGEGAASRLAARRKSRGREKRPRSLIRLDVGIFELGQLSE